ncbi:MAG: hypothetical protein JWM05_2647 [Acidimicrobiales bacterium]|nr:hypothetical protein [Acidimicrobiales bacterium]
MLRSSRIRKPLLAAAVFTSLTIAFGGLASAHVSVDGPAPKGGFGRPTFSVPNERDDASTVKVEVQMPPDHPLASVLAEAKPGWKVAVHKRKLAKPIQGDGETVTEAVDTVTWSGGKIGPGEFETFALSVGPLPSDTDQLVFKAIQTYSDGQEVAWVEPTPADGTEPAHPAPTLTLTAAAADHGQAATPTTQTTGTSGTSAASTKTKKQSSGLAIAALVVALVALGAGGAALAASRRRPASGA